MPRVVLTPRKPTPAGVAPSLVAADAQGHSVPYTRDVMFHVKTSSTAVTATIATAVVFADGLTLPSRAVGMASSSESFIGPFPQQEYMQADGNLYIDFSPITGVTVEAIDPVDV